MTRIVVPGSVIGVLGSGQLGRMFAIAARQMGYRVHTLSPDDDTPTGQVADQEVRADYADLDAVAEFAKRVDVVTFEFENVPVAAAECAARFAPVRPAGVVLHTTQNRRREKEFLQRLGLPITPFATVRSLPELEQAVRRFDGPSVLKTAAWGYDGKGQYKISSPDQSEAAWEAVKGAESVLERWVEFAQEISVVGVRGVDGKIACYEPFANVHRNHILDQSSAPAKVSPGVVAEAIEMTRTILTHLDVIGVVCIEFFVTPEEQLLLNEIAPRPHNSGHLTIDAHVTSQFQQQVRAVCGLPLGSTEQLRPAAMVNLLGDCWAGRELHWNSTYSVPAVHLHLYGKSEPRTGRKMGHLTALSTTPCAAIALAHRARAELSGTPTKPQSFDDRR